MVLFYCILLHRVVFSSTLFYSILFCCVLLYLEPLPCECVVEPFHLTVLSFRMLSYPILSIAELLWNKTKFNTYKTGKLQASFNQTGQAIQTV